MYVSSRAEQWTQRRVGEPEARTGTPNTLGDPRALATLSSLSGYSLSRIVVGLARCERSLELARRSRRRCPPRRSLLGGGFSSVRKSIGDSCDRRSSTAKVLLFETDYSRNQIATAARCVLPQGWKRKSLKRIISRLSRQSKRLASTTLGSNSPPSPLYC